MSTVMTTIARDFGGDFFALLRKHAETAKSTLHLTGALQWRFQGAANFHVSADLRRLFGRGGRVSVRTSSSDGLDYRVTLSYSPPLEN